MAPSVHQGWDPDRLRRHRERHGLTLDQVADAIRNLRIEGFVPPSATFQTVGRHERGESYPGPRYQRAYCHLFGTTPAALGFRPPLPSERGGRGGAAPEALAAPAASSPVAGADKERGGLVPRVPALSHRPRREPPWQPPVHPATVPEDSVLGCGADAAGAVAAEWLAPASSGRAGASARIAATAMDAAVVAGLAVKPGIGPSGELSTGTDGDSGSGAGIGVEEAAARALDGDRLRAAVRYPRRSDVALAESLSVILAAQREIEDKVGSAPLLPPVTAQLAALMPLVFEARGPARGAMVDVAAQWAQFAGWLHANTGKIGQSRVWLDRAAEWAAEAGNASLSANILSYKGHLAWESRAVGPLIGLSQAAQRVPDVYPGQRAYDAGQEARGYAMAGDAAAADRKLLEADRLWEEASDSQDGPPPWSYYFSPAFARLQHGLVHRFLGRHDPRRARRAAAELTAGMRGLPRDQRRAEWAAEYVYHLAVTYIDAGEPEQACRATLVAASIGRATGSRRVSSQVSHLHDRIAGRWPTLHAVTELTERLASPASAIDDDSSSD
ncbi:MAG: helix-turn-helix transcriptional regulator [Frankia sp.]|nr:helix-turn-helix transcriptional regulator [Frankia sp.]